MIITPRFILSLLTLLTVTACAGEPAAPRLAPDATVAAQNVATQTVAVGDEVLLWASWSIAEGSDIDVVITGSTFEGPYYDCPEASYRNEATVQHQKSQSGSTHFPGSEKFYTAESLPRGTRLRFVRWVSACGGWNAYAFQVISVPGK